MYLLSIFKVNAFRNWQLNSCYLLAIKSLLVRINFEFLAVKFQTESLLPLLVTVSLYHVLVALTCYNKTVLVGICDRCICGGVYWSIEIINRLLCY